LKMDTAGSSKTVLTSGQTKWCHISEDSTLYRVQLPKVKIIIERLTVPLFNNISNKAL